MKQKSFQKKEFKEFARRFEDPELRIPRDHEIKVLKNGYKQVTIYNIYTEFRTIVTYDRAHKLASVMVIDDFECGRSQYYERTKTLKRSIENFIFYLKKKFS